MSFVIERDTEPPVAIYDASKDFSLAFNPNGVWSYGWKSTLGGAFTLLPHARTASFDNGVPALTWELASMQHPEVVCNATTNTGISDGGQGQYSPGTLFMTAGFDGRPENFGVIRFTAPAPGTYLIESASRSHLDGDRSGDTDYHVVVDGVEVFAQFLPPRSETGFTNTLTLDAGGTVDLMVGRGADGRLYGSGLKIQATLTGPPNVLQPPTIMTHPQSQEVIAGTNVTLTVSASGSLPMAFQWQLNGTNLDGAISSTLLLTDVQPDMAGVYTVVVTNPSGSVTSDPATLTVLVPPQITLAPQGQDGYWGKSATFMVRAVGTLPLEYAWFKDGFPIDWATNSALVLTNLEMSAGGDYWVTVCNRGGCLTSAPARLVMNPAGVSMGLYPGITIEGVVGKRYGIQYTTNISSTTSWTTVTNFTLVQPVQMWVDTSAEAKSVNYPKRFYRVVPVP